MNIDEFGNTSELFNLYIRVGDIKLSQIQSDDCRFIEVWVCSSMYPKYKRVEIANAKRRPILSVLDDIAMLADGKKACVLLMEDENYEAVHSWFQAVYLVIKYLHRLENIKGVIPFTIYTKEKIDKLSEKDYIYDFFTDTRDCVYNIADAYFCGRSNIYHQAPDCEIVVNNPDCEYIIKEIKSWDGTQTPPAPDEAPTE